MFSPEKIAFKPFTQKAFLATPTMHGEELDYIRLAYDTNWMSTVGENINEVERIAAEKAEVGYAVGLACCTAALHLCVKLAGERLYGKPPISHGALEGRCVFCSDMTFDATLNPVVYEGGIPVFIDTEADSWNMDPIALEKAFTLYPEVKLVVMAHLYGFPAKVDEIKRICEKHGALLIEDAAEAMGATVNGKQCGSFGDYAAISYNGNKIITGPAGGCLLTNSPDDANVVAGVIRGQYPHLEEHIAQKKAIYQRYCEGLRDLPVTMNPIVPGTVPNYWLSALIIDKDAMCPQVRSDSEALYRAEAGKSCPTEILEVLAKYNAEGRPIWKPMHMQPMYRLHQCVGREGSLRCRTNAYIAGSVPDVGADIFARGLCLPSDNKMTPERQDTVIELIRACFA